MRLIRITNKPVHRFLCDDIEIWNLKRQYFYKYNAKDNIQKRKQQIGHDDFFFKCCKEDGLTTEQVVKLKYESEQRKKRLINK